MIDILIIIEHFLAVYAVFSILMKLSFSNKIKNAEVPDIISGGIDCVLPGMDEKQKIRKKWYYKIKEWF